MGDGLYELGAHAYRIFSVPGAGTELSCCIPLGRSAKPRHGENSTWLEKEYRRSKMKKARAVTFDLNLDKEMKSPRFTAAFQKELSRNKLAEQIATLREKHGWTQAALARKVGTTQSGIARLENPDYRNYSLKTLEKVATVLNARLVVGLEEIRRDAA